MAVCLTLDDMLESLTSIDGEQGKVAVAMVENVATVIATMIALRLGVHAERATFEGVAFGGTASAFYPLADGQECPAALADFDPGGVADWAVKA